MQGRRSSSPVDMMSGLFSITVMFTMTLVITLIDHCGVARMFSRRSFAVIGGPNGRGVRVVAGRKRGVGQCAPSRSRSGGRKGHNGGINVTCRLSGKRVVCMPRWLLLWRCCASGTCGCCPYGSLGGSRSVTLLSGSGGGREPWGLACVGSFGGGTSP